MDNKIKRIPCKTFVNQLAEAVGCLEEDLLIQTEKNGEQEPEELGISTLICFHLCPSIHISPFLKFNFFLIFLSKNKVQRRTYDSRFKLKKNKKSVIT